METVIAALGATAAVAGARTAASWAAAAAPFVGLAVVVGAAILVFEDLWVAVEGGESVIGDVAEAFEAWGLDNSTDGSVMGGVIRAWEYLKGVITSTVQLIGEAVGLDPLGDAAASVGQEGTPEAVLAQRLVTQRRAQLGAAENLIPDTTERFLALADARRQLETGQVNPASLAPRLSRIEAQRQVLQEIRIGRIDTTGLTPDQAIRVVETAVQRAMAGQTDETLDALDQGGGSGA